VLLRSLFWQERGALNLLMGADYWRYGIESNRKELELVMRYTYEQGLVKKQVDFEGLFDPSMLGT